MIGKQGRSKGDKKLVSIAVEIREDRKMGRAYARVMNDYSSEELKEILRRIFQKKMQKSEPINGVVLSIAI